MQEERMRMHSHSLDVSSSSDISAPDGISWENSSPSLHVNLYPQYYMLVDSDNEDGETKVFTRGAFISAVRGGSLQGLDPLDSTASTDGGESISASSHGDFDLRDDLADTLGGLPVSSHGDSMSMSTPALNSPGSRSRSLASASLMSYLGLSRNFLRDSVSTFGGPYARNLSVSSSEDASSEDASTSSAEFEDSMDSIV